MSYNYISPGLLYPHGHPPCGVEGDPRWIVAPGQSEPVDPHKWYREPDSKEGWLNTDEAHILYNTALRFSGGKAIEIGSAVGFSAWHILAAGMRVNLVDPAFGEPRHARKCIDSLRAYDGYFDLTCSPGHLAATELGRQYGPWSLVLIDGNHTTPFPALDAVAAEAYCARDAIVLLHDTCYEGPQAAIKCLRALGWSCRIYKTSRRLAACWRGNIEPVDHTPDPTIVELIG